MLFISHKDMLDGKIAVVALEGHLDSISTPDFERYINSLIEAGIFFILLDFDNLKLISSSGIGAVLYLEKKISSSDGALVSCNLKPQIKNLFSILGFSKVLRITETRIEAIETIDKFIELKDDYKDDIILGDTSSPDVRENYNFFTDKSPVKKNINSENANNKDSASEIKDITQEIDLTITPLSKKMNTEEKEIEVQQQSLSQQSTLHKDGIPLKSLIIECSSCNNLIKVTRGGSFQCPHCSAIYNVDPKGTVVFR